jgi:hypothetical protein
MSLQTYTEVCSTDLLGVSQSNQVDKVNHHTLRFKALCLVSGIPQGDWRELSFAVTSISIRLQLLSHQLVYIASRYSHIDAKIMHVKGRE